VNSQTGEVSEYVEDVSIGGFAVRNFRDVGIVATGARDTKFVKNRTFNNGEYGITSFFSTGTKIISNVTSGAEDAAIYVGDSPHANTKIANNDTYDSFSGILVRNALHGQIIANKAHDNCVGILFITDAPGPTGEFEVDGNTVQHNNRACPATAETPRLSGVGIGLLGARSVEIRANHILAIRVTASWTTSAGRAGQKASASRSALLRLRGYASQRRSLSTTMVEVPDEG